MTVKSCQESVERWGVFELTLKGASSGNPFVDVQLGATFKNGNRKVEITGFYDGEGIYRIRFMPDALGKWTYTTSSSFSDLNSITGEFECVEPTAQNHGPVKVVNKYHFAYADGTPYIPFGTTCYGWTYMGEELENETLQTLAKSPFNKVRMIVLSLKKGLKEGEPQQMPFEGTDDLNVDFKKFNTGFYRHFETQIQKLMSMGIEADLILFNPYNKGSYKTAMDSEADDLFLKYTIARFSAYRNVWWSVANEYDLVKTKDMNDWDRYFRIISENDPYYRMCSIHNSQVLYDNRKPWVTHISIQCQAYDRWNRMTESIPEWRGHYNKPVILDECGYEGDAGRFWGCISPQEFMRREWHGIVMGGYVGHGETYHASEEEIASGRGGAWTGQGITLRGQCPERIAFLRTILEEAPVKGLEPQNIGKHIDCAGKAGVYYLAYLGVDQPYTLELVLPEGKDFKVDIIDTWEMKILPVEGNFSGKCKLKLPVKPYLAFRIYAV